MGTRNVEIGIPDCYGHAPVCICIIRGAESDGVNGVPFLWLDPEIWRHPNVELIKLDSQMLYFWLLFGPIQCSSIMFMDQNATSKMDIHKQECH